MKVDVAQQLAKADELIADAEYQLTVAKRAKLLLDAFIHTGEARLRTTDGQEWRQQARPPHLLSQALSMAARFTAFERRR